MLTTILPRLCVKPFRLVFSWSDGHVLGVLTKNEERLLASHLTICLHRCTQSLSYLTVGHSNAGIWHAASVPAGTGAVPLTLVGASGPQIQ